MYSNQSFGSANQTDYPDGVSLAFSPAITALYVAIYVPLWIGIIFANLLVIFAFIYNKDLQHVKYYLLISLSVTDLLTGCIALPCHLVARLVISPLTCFASTRFNFFLPTLIFCGSSIKHLLLIAVDRFLSLLFPFKYRRLVRTRHIAVTILFVWIYQIAACSFPVFKPRSTDNLWVCLSDVNYGGDVDVVYTAVIFFFPCYFFFMMGLYICMIRIATSHIKRRRRMCNGQGQGVDEAKARLRGLITMATVVGTFGVCWLPSVFKFYHEVYLPSTKQELITVQTLTEYVAFVSSMVNPIIYGYFNEQFRTGFKMVLRKWKCSKKTRTSDTYPRKNATPLDIASKKYLADARGLPKREHVTLKLDSGSKPVQERDEKNLACISGSLEDSNQHLAQVNNQDQAPDADKTTKTLQLSECKQEHHDSSAE